MRSANKKGTPQKVKCHTFNKYRHVKIYAGNHCDNEDTKEYFMSLPDFYSLTIE